MFEMKRRGKWKVRGIAKVTDREMDEGY